MMKLRARLRRAWPVQHSVTTEHSRGPNARFPTLRTATQSQLRLRSAVPQPLVERTRKLCHRNDYRAMRPI